MNVIEKHAKIKVQFVLKTNKLSRSTGEAPIYVRLRYKGEKEVLISIGESIAPSDWKRSEQRPIDIGNNGRVYSDLLIRISTLRSKILEIYSDLRRDDQAISPKIIKQILLGERNVKKALIEVFLLFMSEFKQSVKHGERSLGTLRKYETTLVHLKKFLNTEQGLLDIDLDKFNLSMVKGFSNYLLEGKQGEVACAHNTMMQHLKKVKKVFLYAIENDWITKHPFRSFTFRYKPVDSVYLTEEKLNTLMSLKLRVKRLEVIRDLFVFLCWTGLSFSDQKLLSAHDIAIDIDGEKGISDRRNKSGERFLIPIMPPALEILNKYSWFCENSPEKLLLPVPSNQKYNEYLKEIQHMAGLNENLTTKVGRDTCGTLLLSNGVSIEVVQKILGHSNIKQTQKYARVLPQLIKGNLQGLKDKYSNPRETSQNLKSVKKNKAL